MARYEVTVEATWKGAETFEFESEDAAEAFRAAVADGDLNAIVECETGELESHTAELVDWAVRGQVRRVGS